MPPSPTASSDDDSPLSSVSSSIFGGDEDDAIPEQAAGGRDPSSSSEDIAPEIVVWTETMHLAVEDQTGVESPGDDDLNGVESLGDQDGVVEVNDQSPGEDKNDVEFPSEEQPLVPGLDSPDNDGAGAVQSPSDQQADVPETSGDEQAGEISSDEEMGSEPREEEQPSTQTAAVADSARYVTCYLSYPHSSWPGVRSVGLVNLLPYTCLWVFIGHQHRRRHCRQHLCKNQTGWKKSQRL